MKAYVQCTPGTVRYHHSIQEKEGNEAGPKSKEAALVYRLLVQVVSMHGHPSTVSTFDL
jgi:hypothetical protein